MKKFKLAIVLSHPVQYFSPLFKEMAKGMDLKVFYCFNPNPEQQGKDGFDISFKWDVDLFDGYEFEFLENVSKFPSSSTRSGCDTPMVGNRLKQYGATHVVTFGWHLKSYIQTLNYCKRNSIPIAVRGDSLWNSNQSLVKGWLKRLYYPIFLNQFDAFLSVGKRNREYLKCFGIKDHKIIFSPHSVDQSFWAGEKLEKVNFTFIWVGKFIPLKRPNDVIDAFKIIRSRYENLKLKMIGSGELLAQCIEQAKDIRDIEFGGFKNQKELRAEYLGSDVLVLSSDSETWGLVVNEGFSVGLPAIVSSICGCAPDLINSETGRLFPVGNVFKLAEAMEDLLLNFDHQNFSRTVAIKNKIYSFNQVIASFQQFLNLNA